MELGYEIVTANLEDQGFDSIVLVSHGAKESTIPKKLSSAIADAATINENIHEEGAIIPVDLPARRLVYSPTGALNSDYHDVRSFGEAARKGMLWALKAGAKAPIICVVNNKKFKKTRLVTLLGALDALYMNLQWREDRPEKFPKVKKVGVWSDDPSNLASFIQLAKNIEISRTLAKDIGGPDPERMCPPKVEEYVKKAFPPESGIKIQVVTDESVFEKDYPLYAAVNRAASVIDRHKGRIMYLTYEGSAVEKTLFIVGKGVTYDTGGADIKVGGIMIGMCRDKCGSAAVAGFMKLLSLLKPKHLKVVGAMSMVRNSVGENSYVSDEVIMSRAGKRVRVGNTDAEGRMIMADVLAYVKELALTAVNPHLFTIATLTGHACRTVGPGYTISMDNGPARQESLSVKLQSSGNAIGDMIEVSTIRREDFKTHKGAVDGEDVIQAASVPSVSSSRGHQGPAAFLILASGLDKHGLDSDKPLRYTHLDIASSAGNHPEDPTGAPILALATHYLNIGPEFDG